MITVNGKREFPEFIAPMLLWIFQYVLIIFRPFIFIFITSFDIKTLHSSRNISSQIVPRPAVASTQPLIQLVPPECSKRDVKNTHVHTVPWLQMDENIILLLPIFPSWPTNGLLLALLYSTLLYFILLYFTTHRLPEEYEVTGETLCVQTANTNHKCRALQPPCTSSWVLKVHRKR